MKQKIKYIILFLIIFIIFLIINKFLFSDKIETKNLNKAIFNIISETNINIEDNIGLNGETNKYKNILEKKVIGKGFFVNNSGEFLTAKHLFINKNSKFYIEIDNIKYSFNIIKKYKNKDIILGKINNFKNEINKVALAPGNLYIGNNIFTFKNNKKIYGKIVSINQNIDELNLNNLIKINIKLFPGDSGSPIFNERGKVIGVNLAIKKGEDISFFQKINYK